MYLDKGECPWTGVPRPPYAYGVVAARPESPNIGKYRFLVELGSGGMGDVFLAVAQGPKGFNKLQVIKRLRPELAQDPEFLSMFLNEARIAARLNHPNVVQTNEVSEHEDEYFIAMEYLEGQSLYGIIKRAQSLQQKGGQKLPLAMHLHVLAEACEGLHYAHELVDYDGTPLQLVHRDCSPQNVFVTYDGEVKILDFGIAKAADSATFTRTGVLKGKVPYMPPEQLDGAHIDRRADVFAIGAMIWEAAVGVRLWKGLNDIQIAHRLHQKDIPTPSSFEPSVDKKLEAICMKALAIRPDDRFQTAAELQAALDAYVNKLGGVRRRELGKYVSGLFNDTRRQLRSRLEEELRDLVPSWRSLLSTQSGEIRAGASGENPAMTAEEALSMTGETAIASPRKGGTPISNVSNVSGMRAPPSSEPSLNIPAAVPLETTNTQLTQRSTTMSLVPEKPKSRGRSLILAAAAGTVVLLFAVVLLRARQTNEESGAAPAAPAHAPTKEHAVKPTAEPEEIPPTEVKPVDAGPTTKKVEAKPAPGKHPAPVVTASATATAPKTGKPTLDPGDPWQ